ncbi:response regulator [Chamaesiphon sp.]|uniref:hybrid sensor histidine kinase/response regulator n=1 Tax=Chamaesiphon sp. TaxID=2814140 RepID=UPI003593479E
MYIDDDELRGLYKTSATEHIQAIESALMQLEKQPQDSAVLKDLLRSAHTLKGDSRMLGVEDVETLVHQIEECLMPLERGQTMMDEQLCDRLYVGLDTIKQLAHTAVTGEPNDVNMFYVLATLMGDAGVVPPPVTAAQPAFTPDPLVDGQVSDGWITLSNEEPLFEMSSDLWVHENNDLLAPMSLEALPWDTDTPQTNFLELGALFPPDSTLPKLDRDIVFSDFDLMPGTAPTDLEQIFLSDDNLLLMSDISDSDGTRSSVDRSIFDADLFATTFESLSIPMSGDLGEPILFGTNIPTEEVAISSAVDNPIPTLQVQSAVAAPTANVSDYQIETIRVEAKQLDALMGQSGEINVINQQIASRLLDLEAMMELWENGNRDLQQIQILQQTPPQSPLHRQLSRNHQQWEQMGALIAKFKKSIDGDSSRLDLVTSALESGVKKLRLLPLSTIFNLFPRMVRDLAKTQSKEINLAIEGGDLLLDKRLLEEIKDPLTHILRNAIDHGIETPKERLQQDKLTAANLTIQVRQAGNQTTIEILDDGRGLDIQRIKATAIKRGLYTSAELELMSIDKIQSLIFASGFSTRTRVTELSGRGVGLDIVRTNVERIKGSVDVESSPNGGCKFRIVLSHTIGSSQVMMVNVRNQTYAIPVEFVDRMLLVNKAEIFALSGTSTTEIDGQTVTVAWLADLLSLPSVTPHSPGEIKRTSNSIACLLIQSGRQKLALLVDRIDDRQLVTIEAPHPLLKHVPHLAGATILGTGEVCLVLNPIDLLTTAAGGNPLSSKVAAITPIAAVAPAILLVEDSRVIRIQMTRILEGAGYRVTTANDGLEGWEKLQAGQYDLVVSDVEMPRWSGLQLTAAIRSSTQSQVPIVLVTTLSQAVDRDRGFQAGANAYLTKGDFDQQLLLDTLERLI